MTGGVLLARVVLAAVFGLAGSAKLADREGSSVAMREFGMPERLAAPLGTLLPLVEIAIAVTVLLTPTARGGAIAALVLLAAFIAAISVNLARGRQPDCHCFGQLHSAPAGPATLARNALLAAVAAFVAARGPGAGAPTLGRWLGGLSALSWVVIVGALITALVLTAIMRLLLQLMQQNGRLLSAFDLLESRLKTIEGRLGIDAPLLSEGVVPGGLAVGERAPNFSLPTLDGESLSLDALRAGAKEVLLVFTDPTCGPCTALLPDVSRWQQKQAAHAEIVLVSRGSKEANQAKRTEFGLTNVLIQSDREVAEAYRVAGTPSAVLVRPDGTIGSPVVVGADGIRRLVGSPLPPVPHAQPAMPVGIAVGEPAPSVVLTGIDGDSFALSEFEGAPTAVLFWNPSCGFCQRMLDDLKAWEDNPSEGGPQLVVVSSGSKEANRAMQLRSPLALDDHFEVGNLFGAAGTPSAVLIDAEGNVATDVAVGADQVLALLRAGAVAGEPALA